MKKNIILILSIISALLLIGSFPLKLIASSMVIDICRLVGFALILVVAGLRIYPNDIIRKTGNKTLKLTYGVQLIISFIIVFSGSFLTDKLESWIYHSIAYVICGLLFIVHPVVPKHLEGFEKAVFWTRIAGAVLILIGIFTRVHY